MLAPVRTVAPASPIVALPEAKVFLRVDHADEDALIEDLIAAAEGHLDGWAGVLGRCVKAQTWRTLFPTLDDVRLPFPDAQTAVVKYLDTGGVEQTLPAQSYFVRNDEAGGFIEYVPSISLPAVLDRADAVRIDVVYGMAALPPALRQATLLIVGRLYASREGAAVGGEAIDALVAPYRYRTI